MAERYALFAGDVYYPCGGWEDYVGVFVSPEAAMAAHKRSDYGWAHVADLEERTIVWWQYETHEWKPGTPDD